MFAAWITTQLVFNGMVTGLVVGLVAMGIVLIYRSTRVINFAVGNLGVPAAMLLALMQLNWGFPFWVGLFLALVVGTLLGALMELTVVRRLFHRPRVILLVATVGVAQLMRAIAASLPDLDSQGRRFPVVGRTIWEDLPFDLRISAPQVTIIVVVPLVAVALGYVLSRTTFGRAVAASASNPDLARLSGVNPKVVSTFVWTMAGFMSALSIILLSGQSGSVTAIENLGPQTLAKALAAAAICGMRSFPRAVAGGVLIGVGEAVLRFNFLSHTGLIDFVLFCAVFVAVFWQSRDSRDGQELAYMARIRQVPARLQALWWVQMMPRVVLGLGLIFAVVLPLIVELPSRHLLYSTVLGFGICAMSVTVITGWSGQLSLAQMAFAGFGALLAASLTRGFEVDIGYGANRMLDVTAPALPFAVAIVISAVVTGLTAALIGAGALRVRGLMLAITTFAFAVACTQFVFRRPIFGGGSSVPFKRGSLFGIDLTSQRAYYWFMLGWFVVIFVLVARLRQSGAGRALIAVRDNPAGAAACTVSPAKIKIAAFALAGGVAGLGGGLLGGLVQNIRYTESLFRVDDSLRVVGMAVIGGLGSVTGAVLGAVWVEGIPAFFADNEVVPLFSSSIGLLLVIMYIPGGFIQIGYSARDAILRWAEPRLAQTGDAAGDFANDVGGTPVLGGGAVPGTLPFDRTVTDRSTAAESGAVVLAAKDVTVRFGGNVAVNNVSIHVTQSEIVGLIGTNGAGKTTLMNAIGGFVPAKGTIHLLGDDITKATAAKRAKKGLGRTFQAATLFPELTVRETAMVALRARAGRGGSALLRKRSQAQADEYIDWLGLGDHADHYVAELSTGTRRIVELACLLALDAQVLCFDEPTAGVAQSEALAPLLMNIRNDLGASVLLIEHDMSLVMGVSDRVYCLDSGSVIAEGIPSEVQNHPDVITSYLGTPVTT